MTNAQNGIQKQTLQTRSKTSKVQTEIPDTPNQDRIPSTAPMKNCTIQARRERLASRRRVSSTPRRNEEIRSRSCHWHSCRSQRNSNCPVTNELSGQRGRPLQYSPSERAACQVARACSENPALLTHTMHHHISPISPPSPTHSPRLQAHARSCPCPVPALLRSSTRSTARTHLPSGTPSHRGRQRQPVAKRHAQCPWHHRYATHTHTHTHTDAVQQRVTTPAKHLCQCKRSTTLA